MKEVENRTQRRVRERKEAEIRAIKDMEQKRKEEIKLQKQQKSNFQKQRINYWWSNGGKKIVTISVTVVFVLVVAIGLFTKLPSNGIYGKIVPGNPTLMDIGSTSCVPCQQLQPVLNSLGSKYDGVINIKFYDTWNTTEGKRMGEKFNVVSIPTLIFLDGNGNEVARMEGFKEQSVIEAKFRSLEWI